MKQLHAHKHYLNFHKLMPSHKAHSKNNLASMKVLLNILPNADTVRDTNIYIVTALLFSTTDIN